MSGVFSVPFAALAVYAPPEYGQAIWAVLAISAICFALYRVWANERTRLVELEEKMRPKFRLACGPNVPDSSPWAILQGGNMAPYRLRFFRIAVEPEVHGAITNCRGQLLSVEVNGARQWGGDEAILTFAPGENPDATAKTLRDKVTEFLDVLAIGEDGRIIIATPGRGWRYAPTHQIFSARCNYVLTVVLVGDGVASQRVTLDFFWGGNAAASTLTLRE